LSQASGPTLSFFSLMKPANFFWNRDKRPPRIEQLLISPVQAGCDLGSISRWQHVALLAPGRAGAELRTVGHFHRYGAIFGMEIGSWFLSCAPLGTPLEWNWNCAVLYRTGGAGQALVAIASIGP
jgi:hypothetical protein